MRLSRPGLHNIAVDSESYWSLVDLDSVLLNCM